MTRSRWIDIAAQDGTYQGYLAVPKTGKGPGILLLQEIFGVNSHIRAVADQYTCGGSDSFGHRFGVKPVFEKGSVDAEPNGCECRCTGGAGRGA